MTDQETKEAYERFQKAQAAQQAEQLELQRLLQAAQQQHHMVQHEINTRPVRKYAAIVAVDLHGGFSKDGQIPWHYPVDFKFFQNKTRGNVCVMGRTTYDDLDRRQGDKVYESVLPGRKCFVVTSRPLARENAVALKSLTELDFALDKNDVPYDQTVFFIGGERIYSESFSKCDTVYMTVVNKELDCDRFYPKLFLKNWVASNVETPENEPDLKFITWTRPT